jgi:hypothetical protein
MDPNALYLVMHERGQKPYVLVEECKQRDLCADMVKAGCFLSTDYGDSKHEKRFLVYCEKGYTTVVSYPGTK